MYYTKYDAAPDNIALNGDPLIGHLTDGGSCYISPPLPRPPPPPPVPPAMLPKIVLRAQLLTAEPQAGVTAIGGGISGRQRLDVLIMTHGHLPGFTQDMDAM